MPTACSSSRRSSRRPRRSRSCSCAITAASSQRRATRSPRFARRESASPASAIFATSKWASSRTPRPASWLPACSRAATPLRPKRSPEKPGAVRSSWRSSRDGRTRAAEARRAKLGSALEQVILARVADLSEDARALLETISLARGPIEHAIAERAAGLQARRRTAAIALRGARFVSTRGLRDDDVLETSHDRIRETIVASLSDEKRRARHLALARAIAGAARADAESAFEHFLAAGDEDSAREYCPPSRGRRRTRPRIPACRGAVPRGDRPPRRRPRPLVCQAWRRARRTRAAAPTRPTRTWRRRSMRLATRRPSLRRTAAEHYLKSGREEKGLAVLREVLAEVGIRYPESKEAAVASIVWHEARLRLSSLVRRVMRVRRAQSLSPRDLARIDAAFCAATGLALRDPLRGTDFGLRALQPRARGGRAGAARDERSPSRPGTPPPGAKRGAGAPMSWCVPLERWPRRSTTRTDTRWRSWSPGWCTFSSASGEVRRRSSGEADAILRTRCRAVAWELAHAEVWSSSSLILSGELRKASLRIPPALEAARARDDLFALMHLTYPACVSHIVADDVDAAWRVTQYTSTLELAGLLLRRIRRSSSPRAPSSGTRARVARHGSECERVSPAARRVGSGPRRRRPCVFGLRARALGDRRGREGHDRTAALRRRRTTSPGASIREKVAVRARHGAPRPCRGARHPRRPRRARSTRSTRRSPSSTRPTSATWQRAPAIAGASSSGARRAATSSPGVGRSSTRRASPTSSGASR